MPGCTCCGQYLCSTILRAFKMFKPKFWAALSQKVGCNLNSQGPSSSCCSMKSLPFSVNSKCSRAQPGRGLPGALAVGVGAQWLNVCFSTSVILLPQGHRMFENRQLGRTLPVLNFMKSYRIKKCENGSASFQSSEHLKKAEKITFTSQPDSGYFGPPSVRRWAAIFRFIPELHGIDQRNGTMAGNPLSSFQQRPVTLHAIHVSSRRSRKEVTKPISQSDSWKACKWFTIVWPWKILFAARLDQLPSLPSFGSTTHGQCARVYWRPLCHWNGCQSWVTSTVKPAKLRMQSKEQIHTTWI